MSLARFEPKVNRNAANGCSEFTGSLQNGGYGLFWFEGRKMLAHRFAWESEHGPIPDGLEVDHLCRNRRCVNPAHMELVTHAENVRRGRTAESNRNRAAAQTHCKHGHEFTPENTYAGRRQRSCRACNRRRTSAYRQKLATEQVA